jgi:glutaredoxin-related protein
MAEFHADFVDEVRRAIEEHDVVVVGMAQNPHVIRARRALDDAAIPYRYIGHGSYLSGYQRRLAIKLWTGWPTFPQVFVRGELIGGRAELVKAIADGTLRATLDASPVATPAR